MAGLDRRRGRVAGGRVRREPGPADRRARGAGPGRGDRLAGRPLDRHRPCSRTGPSATRRSGAWGAVAGSAGAAGVLLGGILTDGLGWEWVLWVNVPVARDRARVHARPDPGEPLRVGDASLRRGRRGHHHRRPLGPRLCAARRQRARAGARPRSSACWRSSVALIGAFVAIELRSKAPLVPFRIFRLRTLTGANVVGAPARRLAVLDVLFISLYMQQVLGYSAIHAGLSYLPLAVTIIVAAGLGGQLVTRFGFKPILAAGMLFVSAGLALVQPGLGRRRLPDRHPRRLAAGGDRPRVRLRHLDDRRRLRASSSASRASRAG